ncbi:MULTISPECIES: hypothetical protein [Pectobacterium]|uniref:hypothetical protein n=1 Tax=Pectobacterium TaxID=122277 RepID=UPI000DCFAFED|nr:MULTISPECIES: hypothetical protein [Pectobacterium]AZS59316.1 hypothetical protein C5E18_24690 [Pectobacterium parmentieri]
MDEPLNFSLSYEQLTTITEQYIKTCIQNARGATGREAEIEMDWARATLDHWYLLTQAGNAPEAAVDTDRLRMTEMIWRTASEEERACR